MPISYDEVLRSLTLARGRQKSVTLSEAKSLCLNGICSWKPVMLNEVKHLCLNGNATKTPHLYYGSYYVENFSKIFLKILPESRNFFIAFPSIV